MVSVNKYEDMWVKLDNDIICKSNDIRVLWIKIDADLKFEKQLTEACKIESK